METKKDFIDLREIKCSCGHPECTSGISFEEEPPYEKIIFRIHHNRGEEIPMRLDEHTINSLINTLRYYKKQVRIETLKNRRKNLPTP